ncbi:hypothetical protein O3P69_018784 [Scylla paramamosain]|uniref:Uncharacterized protein n=1 Tax=Scylla paramamosain TaxID=85552 RepID=A0AAW0SRM9_SCYPA
MGILLYHHHNHHHHHHIWSQASSCTTCVSSSQVEATSCARRDAEPGKFPLSPEFPVRGNTCPSFEAPPSHQVKGGAAPDNTFPAPGPPDPLYSPQPDSVSSRHTSDTVFFDPPPPCHVIADLPRHALTLMLTNWPRSEGCESEGSRGWSRGTMSVVRGVKTKTRTRIKRKDGDRTATRRTGEGGGEMPIRWMETQ